MIELKTANPGVQKLSHRSTVSPLLWELAQGDPALALKKLETSLQGLTYAEAERRQRIHGKNEVAHEKPRSWWAQVIKVFSNPFILVLAGFIAFLDPPKPSAGAAIKALSEHGVRVKIITGDNANVAAKVCQEVGLDPGDIILGHEIEEMSEEELGFFAEGTKVFTKMNPLQKARVVRALKARGHTVGFLGDGINDAVALRTADVGISVDTAVDVAKESADICNRFPVPTFRGWARLC